MPEQYIVITEHYKIHGKQIISPSPPNVNALVYLSPSLSHKWGHDDSWDCLVVKSHFIVCVFFFKFDLCIYLSLAACGLSPVVASRSYSRGSTWASACGGLSRCGAPALIMRASVVVVHRLGCPKACGIFPHQGSIPCRLLCKMDS